MNKQQQQDTALNWTKPGLFPSRLVRPRTVVNIGIFSVEKDDLMHVNRIIGCINRQGLYLSSGFLSSIYI